MADPIVIFSSSNGLNNKIDPVRLPYDPDTGVQDLAVPQGVIGVKSDYVKHVRWWAPVRRAAFSMNEDR